MSVLRLGLPDEALVEEATSMGPAEESMLFDKFYDSRQSKKHLEGKLQDAHGRK